MLAGFFLYELHNNVEYPLRQKGEFLPFVGTQRPCRTANYFRVYKTIRWRFRYFHDLHPGIYRRGYSFLFAI